MTESGSHIKRILVTGSRGKSSLVRLIHTACLVCGKKAYGRITGVLPRELSPHGQGLILRRAGAHVEEMAWWLKRVPPDAEAVILENSAIHPDLQHLAARWLRPDLVVLSNTFPDHQQAWGAGPAQAAEALARGIPKGSLVAMPQAEAARGLLEQKKCRIKEAAPASEFADGDHLALNRALALTACGLMNLDLDACRQAMNHLPPDLADFRVERVGEGSLALAFSANDPASTGSLFKSLGWARDEATLLYNHRADRADRLKAFSPLMSGPWQKVLVIGSRPWPLPKGSRFIRLRDAKSLAEMIGRGGRWFGCGNLAGLPLEYLLGSQVEAESSGA